MKGKVGAAVLHIMERGPDRVMTSQHGSSPTIVARSMYKQLPVVIFIRDDGWSLGASKKHIHHAERLWRDKWAAVLIKPSEEPIAYSYWCEHRYELIEALP